MKQRLLSLVALAVLLVGGGKAQSWNAPIPEGSELQSSSEARVYLYNVGAGLFLCGGTAWGTHAALSAQALPVRLTQNEDETWQIYFFEGSKAQQLMGRENESDIYIDYNGQAGWSIKWTFTNTTGVTYRLQTDVNDATFGQENMPGTWTGNATSREDYDSDNNIIGTHVGVYGNITENEEGANLDWYIVSEDAFAAWKLRFELKSLLEQAVELDVDYTAGSNVYNNSAATADEIQTAIDNQKEINRQKVLDGASPDNPVDLTQLYIVNPDFEGKSTQGWTLTGEYAKAQNNSPHPIQEGEGEGEEGLDTGGWLEFWKSGGIDADQDAHQVVTDLPVGSYRLQLVGCGQGGKLYAITNGIRQEATIPNNNVQRISFDFVHMGGDLTLGFDFKPAAGNTIAWVAVDKFRLYYLGKSAEDETLTMLRNALNTFDPYQYKISDALFQEATSTQQSAQALVDAHSDDADANTEALNAISTMNERMAQEAAAYTKLENFINNTIKNDLVRYDNSPSTTIQDLYDKLESYETEFQNAYDLGSWDEATIDQKIEEYNNEVSTALDAYKGEIKQAFDNAVQANQPLDTPLDITALFADELDISSTLIKHVENSFDQYGWTFKSSQDFDGNDGLKFEHGTAEAWSCVFDANKTLKNLPAGKYTIRAKAFYRSQSMEENNAQYNADEQLAFFYVGANKTPIRNIAPIGATETFTGAIEVEFDGAPLYYPNTQQSARAFFDGPNGNQAVVEASSIVDESGTLTFGVNNVETDENTGASLASDCWTIWGDLQILYNGAAGADDYNIQIQGLLDQLEGLDDWGVNGTRTIIEQASAAGEAALTQGLEQKLTAIKQMQDAVQASELSEQLTNKVSELQQVYEDMKNELDGTFTDTKLDDILGEIDNAWGSEEFESNEQIQGWIDALPAAWCDYVLSMQGLEDATEDNPVEVPIIVNGTFDSGNRNGWTIEEVARDGSEGNGCSEFWNTTSFDIYQTIHHLRDGFYRLSVNAFYRYGNTADEVKVITDGEELQNNAYLYVNSNEKKLMQWSDINGGAYDADPSLEGVSSYNEGSFFTTNNKAGFATMVENGRYVNEIVFGYGSGIGTTGSVRVGLKKAEKLINYDWVPFDNFRLEYLGTERPTAVEAVEAQTNAAPAAIFTIDGRQQSSLSRGINIVRQANGKVMKVLVK